MASRTKRHLRKEICWFLYVSKVLLCNVAAAAAYSVSAKTSSAVTAGADMYQRRNGQRQDSGAETAALKCPAPYINSTVFP